MRSLMIKMNVNKSFPSRRESHWNEYSLWIFDDYKCKTAFGIGQTINDSPERHLRTFKYIQLSWMNESVLVCIQMFPSRDSKAKPSPNIRLLTNKALNKWIGLDQRQFSFIIVNYHECSPRYFLWMDMGRTHSPPSVHFMGLVLVLKDDRKGRLWWREAVQWLGGAPASSLWLAEPASALVDFMATGASTQHPHKPPSMSIGTDHEQPHPTPCGSSPSPRRQYST